MTSNVQIDQYLSGHPGYRGAFPADSLPPNISPGDSLVVNYDNHNDGGSHWVAMRFPPDAPAEYFDSFGFAPDADDKILKRKTRFAEYLAEHSFATSAVGTDSDEVKDADATDPHLHGVFVYNKTDFQSAESDTCGIWAAWFVLGALDNPADLRALLSMKGAVRDNTVRKIFGSERDSGTADEPHFDS